jgi:hypothetical protein
LFFFAFRLSRFIWNLYVIYVFVDFIDFLVLKI